MNRNQDAEMVSYDATAELFEAHPELTELSPLLAKKLLEFNQIREFVKAQKSIQMNILVGYGTNKNALRKSIEAEVDSIGNGLISIYDDLKMGLESARAKTCVERFISRRDADMQQPVQAMCEDALKLDASVLAQANLTADEINNLLNSVNAFQKLVTGRHVSLEEQKLATTSIRNSLAKLKNLTRGPMLGLMKVFRNSKPEVLELYKRVITVDYPGRRHRKPVESDTTAMVTIEFTDAVNGNSIEGVAISVNGKLRSEISDENGEIYLDDLLPAIYHIVASVPGYHTIEWDTPVLDAGQSYEFEQPMNPETAL